MVEAMTDEPPIVHVRRPGLPWRIEHGKTECGLPVAGHPVITRTEFLAKIKREGERRARITTCQTCLDTARRHPSWDENPEGCLSREIPGWGRARPSRFRTELLALAALAARHREEFTEIMEDIEAVVPIAEGSKARRPQ